MSASACTRRMPSYFRGNKKCRHSSVTTVDRATLYGKVSRMLTDRRKNKRNEKRVCNLAATTSRLTSHKPDKQAREMMMLQRRDIGVTTASNDTLTLLIQHSDKVK